MLPARSGETPFEFPGADLELLAQVEHKRFVAERIRQGFTTVDTGEDAKRDIRLVGWDELTEEVKEIDRDLIRGIPRMLSRAGYALVKVCRGKPPESKGAQ